MINHFCYVDSCDSNNNGALIGAVIGVDCAGIIVMMIINLVVWIYCFRKRQHTGSYTYCYVRICT